MYPFYSMQYMWLCVRIRLWWRTVSIMTLDKFTSHCTTDMHCEFTRIRWVWPLLTWSWRSRFYKWMLCSLKLAILLYVYPWWENTIVLDAEMRSTKIDDWFHNVPQCQLGVENNIGFICFHQLIASVHFANLSDYVSPVWAPRPWRTKVMCWFTKDICVQTKEFRLSAEEWRCIWC